MGAQTKTTQVSTLTPDQQKLQAAQIAAVLRMLGQGGTTNLGGTYGGARSFTPSQGQAAPTGQGLADILASNAYGARDKYTRPFVSPRRRDLSGV